MKLGALRIVLIGIFIYPAADRFGLLGVAAAIVGAAVIMAPVEAYSALRLIDGSALRYLRTLIPPTIGSAIMGGVVWKMQDHMAIEAPLLEFVALLGVGIAAYTVYTGIAVWLFDYRIEDELKTIVRSIK